MRRLLAVLCSAAPFVAGAIAALSARHDLRLLWMTVAATLAARLVLGVVPVRWGATFAAGAALATAIVAACAVAVWFGARGAVGVGLVALVLGGCAAAGAVLGRRPRPAA
jgi:hypothetical protein